MEEASGPPALYVFDLSREELVDIVARASKASLDSPQYRYYCALFDRNVAMIGASQLIPYREAYEDADEESENAVRTPEQVVDIATDPKHVIIG